MTHAGWLAAVALMVLGAQARYTAPWEPVKAGLETKARCTSTCAARYSACAEGFETCAIQHNSCEARCYDVYGPGWPTHEEHEGMRRLSEKIGTKGDNNT